MNRPDPQGDAELIERLRMKEHRGRYAHGGGSIGPDGKGTFYGGEKIMELRNPDGPDAAKRIEELLTRLSASPIAERLWLWKNFVGGKPEYWAFDNPYPRESAGGDPLALGEPCGWAILKPSINGRPDIDPQQVADRVAALAATTTPQEGPTERQRALAEHTRLSEEWCPDDDDPLPLSPNITALAGAENWEVGPCKDRLGHTTSWDINIKPEPGAEAVAVIASVYSGEEVARAILTAIKAQARLAPQEGPSEAVTDAMLDAGADAFDEAVEKAKAERKARNDEHEAAGRGRPSAETSVFPIDWLEAVYTAMRSAASQGSKP